MRALSISLLLLVAAALAPPAGARDPFGPGGRPSSGIGRPTAGGTRWAPDQPSGARSRYFSEQRKAEAGVRLQQQHRDNQHRAAAARLRRSGTPAQVRAHRARVEAVERADDLRIRGRLAEVDPVWWNSLGPNTRRVFRDSGLVVRRAQRQQDLRRELDQLEHEVETRDQPTVWSPPGTKERR